MPVFQDRNVDPSSGFSRQVQTIPLAPAVSLNKRTMWARKYTLPWKLLAASLYSSAQAGAVTVRGWIVNDNGLIGDTALAIDAVPEKFKTTAAFDYIAAGVIKTKAATTAIVFSSAYTINNAQAGQKWGAIVVQINRTTGTISTKTVSADQAYASEALALAAAPAADAGNSVIGVITIQSKNDLKWTANTDDLVAASDLGAVNFYATGAAGGAGKAGSFGTLAFTIVGAAGDTTPANLTATHIRQNQFLVITSTTDGTGALTNGLLTLETRAFGMRGDNPAAS